MKHQYFGDINDYRKYGLLRALLSHTSVGLHVAWMLTPDDGSPDGSFRSYLQQPDRWKRFDPELYAGLAALAQRPVFPRVSLLEATDLLPGATFFSELVPDRLPEREVWSTALVRGVRDTELVFLDPDNGVEIRSQPAGRRGSSKYVRWSEIESIWSLGASLLVYQHFPRKPRSEFTAELIGEFQRRTGSRFLQAFCTAHVLFVLAAQPHHEAQLRAGTSQVLTRWPGQITRAA